MPSGSTGERTPREQFISDFSHEARSPLHAIIGFSELLEDEAFGKLNLEQQAVVEDIHAAAQYLLQLISDTVDFTRLSIERLELKPERVALAAAVEQAVHATFGVAEELEVQIEMQVPRDLAVHADERRLVQVLTNLLSNAVRYSPPGSVVRVTVETRDGVVWTLVSDDGYGIAAEDLERVFAPFVAIRCGEVEPGAGLGLAVARSLIEAMGGELRAESTPGEGSVFRFSLPAG